MKGKDKSVRNHAVKLSMVFMAVSMLSGCTLFKNHYRDGSVALVDYPMERFKEVTREEDKLILKDVNFDYNSFKIKPEFSQTLDDIYQWLKNNFDRTLHVLVTGNCDERGSNDYNLALGEQRALSVRSYLVDKGIKAERIQTISYGEERPLDTAHNEKAWEKNRRTHFLVASEE